jgi:hypothetical protein
MRPAVTKADKATARKENYRLLMQISSKIVANRIQQHIKEDYTPEARGNFF